MARVITFSRTFPAYHPKARQPTFFVEKCWKSFYENGVISTSKISELSYDLTFPGRLFVDEVKPFLKNFEPKNHTIRVGSRWKVGDKFSPRVWSNKPYNSKQIQFAPDMEVKKLWSFEIKNTEIFVDGKKIAPLDKDKVLSYDAEIINEIAKNDGLTNAELFDWFKFPKPFIGQIICWNETINYEQKKTIKKILPFNGF